MKKVLSICENVREVYLNYGDPAEEILEALGRSVPHLRLVANASAFKYFSLDLSENQLFVVEKNKPYLSMTNVLNRFTSKPIVLVSYLYTISHWFNSQE